MTKASVREFRYVREKPGKNGSRIFTNDGGLFSLEVRNLDVSFMGGDDRFLRVCQRNLDSVDGKKSFKARNKKVLEAFLLDLDIG